MAWAKLDDGLDEHAKVEQLLEADEVQGFAAVGLFACLLAQTSRRLEEGRFTRRHLAKLAPEQGEQLLELLIGVGLVDVLGDGTWTIHDYLDHNPTKAEALSEKAKRKARARKAALTRWGKPGAHAPEHAREQSSSIGVSPLTIPGATEHAAEHSESDARSNALEHRLGHSGIENAPEHAAEHAPLAMPRPVPSRPNRERETRERTFQLDDPLAPLGLIDNGSSRFEAAWMTEQAEVRALLAAEPVEVQNEIVKRIVGEAHRWEGRSVRFFVESDMLPAARRRADRALPKGLFSSTDRKAQEDEFRAEMEAVAAQGAVIDVPPVIR